jgi:hypothetical protein
MEESVHPTLNNGDLYKYHNKYHNEATSVEITNVADGYCTIIFTGKSNETRRITMETATSAISKKMYLPWDADDVWGSLRTQ